MPVLQRCGTPKGAQRRPREPHTRVPAPRGPGPAPMDRMGKRTGCNLGLHGRAGLVLGRAGGTRVCGRDRHPGRPVLWRPSTQKESIRMCAASRRYTRQEDDFLRANYRSMLSRELASRLRRPLRSVDSRLGKLGLRRFRTIPFTEAEDEAIRAGFGARTSVAVADELGRAPAVIRCRARRLGLGSWKGALKDFRGYKVAKIDQSNGASRRVPEHRAVVERQLGRGLTDTERVHHINLRKRDNRPENLHLCDSPSAHSRAHHSINKLIPVLLERGIVHFDRAAGVYRLCEIGK